MKYLVVIQLSSGIRNATIFGTLKKAKAHLSDVVSDFKYPIEVKWEDDENVYAKITASDWVGVRIIKTERAEYRLVRHARREKDEERRFSVYENAIDFVSNNYNGSTSAAENSLGEWMGSSNNEYIFKLYAVILDPEKSSRKVAKRFNAATSRSILFNDIEEYLEDDETQFKDINEDAEHVATVNEKEPVLFLSRIVGKVRLAGKKNICHYCNCFGCGCRN